MTRSPRSPLVPHRVAAALAALLVAVVGVGTAVPAGARTAEDAGTPRRSA